MQLLVFIIVLLLIKKVNDINKEKNDIKLAACGTWPTVLIHFSLVFLLFLFIIFLMVSYYDKRKTNKKRQRPWAIPGCHLLFLYVLPGLIYLSFSCFTWPGKDEREETDRAYRFLHDPLPGWLHHLICYS